MSYAAIIKHLFANHPILFKCGFIKDIAVRIVLIW